MAYRKHQRAIASTSKAGNSIGWWRNRGNNGNRRSNQRSGIMASAVIENQSENQRKTIMRSVSLQHQQHMAYRGETKIMAAPLTQRRLCTRQHMPSSASKISRSVSAAHGIMALSIRNGIMLAQSALAAQNTAWRNQQKAYQRRHGIMRK